MQEIEAINSSKTFHHNPSENSTLTFPNATLQKSRNKNSFSKSKQRIIFFPIVLILITCAFLCYYKYFKYAYIDKRTIEHLEIEIIFYYLMIILTYFLSALTEPHQTNVNKYFDSSNNIMNIDQSQPGKEIKSLNIEQWDFCQFCASKKFIRASHCRKCNKCILFRDHHCPWIANCIGYQNFQYFANLIFWLLIGEYYIITGYIKFASNFSKLVKNEQLNVNYFILIITTFGFLIYFLIAIWLFILFIKLNLTVYNNKTTIEDLKEKNIETYYPFCYRDNKNSKPNNYNIGFLAHYYYLIGPTLFHLALPIPKCQSFVLNEDCPIFAKCKQPSRMELVKFLTTVNEQFRNVLNQKDNEPEYFIELAHKHYDGKEIV